MSGPTPLTIFEIFVLLTVLRKAGIATVVVLGRRFQLTAPHLLCYDTQRRIRTLPWTPKGIHLLRCLRCGYGDTKSGQPPWLSRNRKPPATCPRCHSRAWCREPIYDGDMRPSDHDAAYWKAKREHATAREKDRQRRKKEGTYVKPVGDLCAKKALARPYETMQVTPIPIEIYDNKPPTPSPPRMGVFAPGLPPPPPLTPRPAPAEPEKLLSEQLKEKMSAPIKPPAEEEVVFAHSMPEPRLPDPYEPSVTVEDLICDCGKPEGRHLDGCKVFESQAS